MKGSLPADELLELVVANGYERAADIVGVSTSHLWKMTDRAGIRQEVIRRRGRGCGALTQARAADMLGTSEYKVCSMIKQGRLSYPLDATQIDELREAWGLVVYDQAAEVASYFDPCWRRCRVCRSYFRIKRSWVNKSRGMTCSIRCRDEWRRMLNPTIKVVNVPAPKVVSAGPFCAGYCAGCGAAFVRERKVKYCSPECAATAHRDARKARERGAVKIERVYRQKVYDRDKWRCHICKGKIDPNLSAPDPGAATLDHIHPLSLGGSHTYDNIKAAHYGCNSARGNRASFQMRMQVAA